jgi:hypothetical protein
MEILQTFKCFGKTLTNEDDDDDELQSKLHSGDPCFTSIHFRILHFPISYLKS